MEFGGIRNLILQSCTPAQLPGMVGEALKDTLDKLRSGEYERQWLAEEVRRGKFLECLFSASEED